MMESRCRVLLVDDEDEFRAILQKRLSRRGIDAQGAQSGEEALVVLEERDFDVVVLDMKMPGMDGLETLKGIKARHPATEVVMLTGHASVEAAIQGMEMGAFDYLIKPVDLSELVYKIQDAQTIQGLRQNEARVREGGSGNENKGGG